MPRKPRREEAGAIHHVFARGAVKQVLFRDDEDRLYYLALLSDTAQGHEWGCFSYCLMDNHVHLLVETALPNLGRGMQVLHGEYATAFNRRHGGSGHVFQGRFGSTRITSDAHLWTAAAYVANNPVEAGLCRRPEDWAWSSHRTIVESRPSWLARDRLLECFSIFGGDPLERYAEFVGAAAA